MIELQHEPELEMEREYRQSQPHPAALHICRQLADFNRIGFNGLRYAQISHLEPNYSSMEGIKGIFEFGLDRLDLGAPLFAL